MARQTQVHRRLLDANVQILDTPPDRPDFLHTVLCQCAMPRSRAEGEVFERTNGNVSLRIKSGELWDGRQWQRQGLPYGTRPRLALVHICAEAVRTQSRRIDVGDSTKAFLDRLGISTGGHEYTRFKNQMKALSAAQMQMGIGGETLDLKPIRRFSAWLHPTGSQRVLWPGTLELTADFYETLMVHAVPLDNRALAALSHSSLALDTYTWFAHRLHRVPEGQGVKLSWANLRAQFGQEYNDPKNFKAAMQDAIQAALTVYPHAHVDEETGGIRLRNSPPPVQASMVPVNKRG